MSEVALLVNGKRFEGWESVRIHRSLESLTGAFDLGVSDQWAAQKKQWPIVEEDECRVQIDGEQVIKGFVDKRSISISAGDRTLDYSGRDAASALVDCSAVLDKWTFHKATIQKIAEAVAHPFGVPVFLQSGLQLPPALPKLVVNPGDTPFEVIQSAAKNTAVLAISDGNGGIILTRAGAERAEALEQGRNVLSASINYDGDQRFARYVVVSQTPGTDETNGHATRIRAEATDAGVRRGERVLLIRSEKSVSTDYARRRGDWEARVRAARAEKLNVVVVGWKQTSGALWPINAIVSVNMPAIGIKGQMLIAEVEFTVSNQGQVTALSLVRPDAFTPDLKAAKVKADGTWNELRKGAL